MKTSLKPPVSEIILYRDVLNLLQDITDAHRPYECCAALFGRAVGHTLKISQAASLPNRRMSRSQFGIAEDDFMSLLSKVKLPFCGLYHSQKQSLFPSKKDIVGIKQTRRPWLIGTMESPSKSGSTLKVRAYASRGEHVFVVDHRIKM